MMIWLPLNGNANNKGIYNSSITTNACEFLTNGKTGKALDCMSGSSSYIDINYPMDSNTVDYTICFWVYLSHQSDAHTIFSTDSSNKLSVFVSNGKIIWYTEDAPQNSFCDIEYDKWVHCCFSIKHNLPIKLYINGSYAGEAQYKHINCTKIRLANNITANNQLNGMMNDFRIYEEFLSQREIKEISKSLICHYPMDIYDTDIVEYDCSGYLNDGRQSSDILLVEDSCSKHGTCYNLESSQYIIGSSDTFVTDEITVSVWAYMDSWSDTTLASCVSGNYGWILDINNDKPRFSVSTEISSTSDISAISKESLTSGWHLFTGTFGENCMRIFVDGLEKGQCELNSDNHMNIVYNMNNTFFLHANASNNKTTPTTERFPACRLSDFRIYATSLSINDVKELYNVPISVSNDGSILTSGSFIENETDESVKIHKNGNISSLNIFEVIENNGVDQNVSQFSIGNNYINSSNIIEY